MRWLLVFLGLAVAAAGVASWHYLSPGEKGAEGPAARPNLAAGRPPEEIQSVGYVEPASEVRKLMMRTGGVIKRCRVRAGDSVRKDEPILELDDATQRADVQVARKNLELARADAAHVGVGINPFRIKVVEQTVERLREKFRYCRAESDRYRAMMLTKAASPQEYEAIETQRRQIETELKEQEAELLHLRNYVTPEHKAMLEAKVRHAQAALELAEERLREARLLSPFDGTVLKLLKREGEGVRTFEPEPVVLFGDLAKLRVRAEVDERFVQHVTVGQVAAVYGRNLNG